MSNYEQDKIGGQLIGVVRGQKKGGRKEDGEGVEVVGGAEEGGAIVEEEFYQLKVRRRWGRVKRVSGTWCETVKQTSPEIASIHFAPTASLLLHLSFPLRNQNGTLRGLIKSQRGRRKQ